jgi:hypothetical protein
MRMMMMLPLILRNALNSTISWERILRRNSFPVLSIGLLVRLFSSRSWTMIWKRAILRMKMMRKKMRKMRITTKMSLMMM